MKIMQNAKFKMQNDNTNFKKEFIKRLIRFSLDVIKLCNEMRKDRNLWVIADQLIRSGTSIGANVIEAKAASSLKDYIRYFEIALKSANETNYWLILAKESAPGLSDHIRSVTLEANEIAKIIGTSIVTMKEKR